MRKLILFTLLLASNPILACLFYPFGDDIRISLFHPNNFNYSSYNGLNYSASLYASNANTGGAIAEQNIDLWSIYCKGNVTAESIAEAVYVAPIEEFNEHSNFPMIKYLYSIHDIEAIEYLRFAKSCELLNAFSSDPWERKEVIEFPVREARANEALKLIEQVENVELKKRYAFIAIRLFWYNSNYSEVQSIFSTYFEKVSKRDVIYYWSLYFNALSTQDTAKSNFMLAQVFANAADKRFIAFKHYHARVQKGEVLKFAKNNGEKANVVLVEGLRKVDRALPLIKEMYSLNASSEGLSFLLLREINKIEDFVLTPSYTTFQPSIITNLWYDAEDFPSSKVILNRAERDRKYAKELLNFIKSVDLKKVENPTLWKLGIAYLKFIVRDYNGCISDVHVLETLLLSEGEREQLEVIEALALIANQKGNFPIIPERVQQIILSHASNSQFVFIVGRELEFQGNRVEAALLYSTLSDNWDSERESYGSVYWKNRNSKYNHPFRDYFWDYWDYLDAEYSAEEVRDFIAEIKEFGADTTGFNGFKFREVKEQLAFLYDMLGTKYVRENQMEKAAEAFSNLTDWYWSKQYSAWGDGSNVFDKNPFFHLKYTPEFIAQVDTIRLNKYNVTVQLMEYLKRAEDANETERDYYYFLVANGYFNMSCQGNSWMMRRFYYSTYDIRGYVDDSEYYEMNLAKEYYGLAKKYAKTREFEALCVRMMARCEKNRIFHSQKNSYDEVALDKKLSLNKYYLELKNDYSDYFEELESDCYAFERYFASRR